MAAFGKEHAELEQRVRELEAQLVELRRLRVETYAAWWSAREARDRSLHVARRLRRRLERYRRRGALGESLDGLVEGLERPLDGLAEG